MVLARNRLPQADENGASRQPASADRAKIALFERHLPMAVLLS